MWVELRRAMRALLFASILPGVCAAAGFPDRAIRLIVPFAPAGGADATARVIAEQLGRALGQAVVVENKPGASGNIGADAIAKADDRHTIGVIGNGPLTSS